MAAPGDPAASASVIQCEVTLVHEHARSVRRSTLRVGDVLRIGRGPDNDVVLNFEGVSAYHAELFLRPGATGQGLCVRDNSKNGTGVKPGPSGPADREALGVPPWEPVHRGTFKA
ncbi:unnamed protein product, partial [Prorocentrum cordatum]